MGALGIYEMIMSTVYIWDFCAIGLGRDYATNTLAAHIVLLRGFLALYMGSTSRAEAGLIDGWGLRGYGTCTNSSVLVSNMRLF